MTGNFIRLILGILVHLICGTTVNGMVNVGLALQGASTSALMLLTWLSLNIANEGLIQIPCNIWSITASLSTDSKTRWTISIWINFYQMIRVVSWIQGADIFGRNSIMDYDFLFILECTQWPNSGVLAYIMLANTVYCIFVHFNFRKLLCTQS